MTSGLTGEAGPSPGPQAGWECVLGCARFVLAVALRRAPVTWLWGSCHGLRDLKALLARGHTAGRTGGSHAALCRSPLPAPREGRLGVPSEATARSSVCSARLQLRRRGRENTGRGGVRRAAPTPQKPPVVLGAGRVSGQSAALDGGRPGSRGSGPGAGSRARGWAPQGHVSDPDGGPRAPLCPRPPGLLGAGTRTTPGAHGPCPSRSDRAGRNRCGGHGRSGFVANEENQGCAEA